MINFIIIIKFIVLFYPIPIYTIIFSIYEYLI